MSNETATVEEKIRPEGTAAYGQFYWCIKSLLGPNRGATDIYLNADYFEVRDGCLLFYGEHRKSYEDAVIPKLLEAFAPGSWKAVYAASCLDGSAVAVEHWNGEVE